MNILDFLLRYNSQHHKPEDWARYLNIKIIDPDGWRGKYAPSFDEPCSLDEFVRRISSCTIQEQR